LSQVDRPGTGVDAGGVPGQAASTGRWGTSRSRRNRIAPGRR
jgi:hypothetical protein